MPPRTAAVKAFSPGTKAHCVDDAELHTEQEPRDATHEAAKDEGERDGPIDVDAHEACRLGVLGHGTEFPIPSFVRLTTRSSTTSRTRATTMVRTQSDWTPTPQR